MEEVVLLIKTLKREIKRKDKIAILRCYDELERVNWDDFPDLFEEYDQIVNRANEILLT